MPGKVVITSKNPGVIATELVVTLIFVAVVSRKFGYYKVPVIRAIESGSHSAIHKNDGSE